MPGVPLLFGLPVPEAHEAAEHGELALGGCVLHEPVPNWQCPRGHRWRDADQAVHDQQVSTVLAAHGYRP